MAERGRPGAVLAKGQQSPLLIAVAEICHSADENPAGVALIAAHEASRVKAGTGLLGRPGRALRPPP